MRGGLTENDARQDGLVGMLGDTRIGLIFLGASIGDQGAVKILFRVGRPF